MTEVENTFVKLIISSPLLMSIMSTSWVNILPNVHGEGGSMISFFGIIFTHGAHFKVALFTSGR